MHIYRPAKRTHTHTNTHSHATVHACEHYELNYAAKCPRHSHNNSANVVGRGHIKRDCESRHFSVAQRSPNLTPQMGLELLVYISISCRCVCFWVRVGPAFCASGRLQSFPLNYVYRIPIPAEGGRRRGDLVNDYMLITATSLTRRRRSSRLLRKQSVEIECKWNAYAHNSDNSIFHRNPHSSLVQLKRDRRGDSEKRITKCPLSSGVRFVLSLSARRCVRPLSRLNVCSSSARGRPSLPPSPPRTSGIS